MYEIRLQLHPIINIIYSHIIKDAHNAEGEQKLEKKDEIHLQKIMKQYNFVRFLKIMHSVVSITDHGMWWSKNPSTRTMY